MSSIPEISCLISKLSAPQLIHRISLPCFRQTCSFPTNQSSTSNPSTKSDSDSSPKKNESQITRTSISWSDFHLQSQSSLTNPTPSSFSSFFSSLSTPPRIVFFGEHHHQPGVLKAQLQALNSYHQLFTSLSTSQKNFVPNLVLEQFSLSSQSSLNRFHQGEIDFDELNQEYQEKSGEGFDLMHYFPLLSLAKELGIKVWGGFPEREWAKVTMRDGIEKVKELEKERIQEKGGGNGIGEFKEWEDVMDVGIDHRTYLKSLMNPDKPQSFPGIPVGGENKGELKLEDLTSEESTRYPTKEITPSLPESKGFTIAQCLKDCYLAHVILEILSSSSSSSSTFSKSSSSIPSSSNATSTSTPSNPEIIPVIFAITGSGHCEYSFGAPSKLKSFSARSEDSELKELDPVVLICKPRDGEVWLGDEWEGFENLGEEANKGEEEDKEKVEGVEKKREMKDQKNEIKWQEQGWDRKLGDLVVLYDWVDS